MFDAYFDTISTDEPFCLWNGLIGSAPGHIRCKSMKLYRFLSEEDTSAFCHKVSDALAKGWTLYGDPAYAFDEKTGKMRCAQAVIKEVDTEYHPEMKLGAQ